MTQTTNTTQTYENPAYLPEQPPAYDEIASESQETPKSVLDPVGPKPFITMCPSCHQQICTKVVMRTTVWTHLLAMTLCLLECYLCACLPYCISACNNADHTCPNCSTYLGTYKN